MFLVKQDFDINDFLKALGFVAPKGFQVDYIMTPENEGTPAQQANVNMFASTANLTPQPQPGIKYLKKDLSNIKSFSDNYFAPSNDQVNLVSFPAHTQKPNPAVVGGVANEVANAQKTNYTLLKSPDSGAVQVVENQANNITLLLKESDAFPRNTLINLKRS